MRLFADAETALDLELVGYQFPELHGRYWDSNWLQVRVAVMHPRGNWSKVDPCLLAFEVDKLIEWLERVATGAETAALCRFLEPYLIFAVIEADGQRALRVCFSGPLRPPWSPAQLQPRSEAEEEAEAEAEEEADDDFVERVWGIADKDVFVQYPVASADLAAAAAGLRSMLRQFPQRAFR